MNKKNSSKNKRVLNKPKKNHKNCKRKNRSYNKPAAQVRIAKERIEELFKQADNMFDTDQDLANRYVALARKIAMKFKVRIPGQLKRRFCRHCYKYLKPGINLRIRTRKKTVVYYCLECKKFMRFKVKPRQK